MTDEMTETLIKPKDRDTVIQSLQAGVVPRRGQALIQVGRVEEIKALIRDLDRMADGGSAIRFAIGEYGSGKTFFSVAGAIDRPGKEVCHYASGFDSRSPLTCHRRSGAIALCRANAQCFQPAQSQKAVHCLASWNGLSLLR